jgi:TIR domain
MAEIQFVVRHAEADERYATWTADLLHGAGFTARKMGLDDLEGRFAAIGTIVLLSRRSREVSDSLPFLPRRGLLGVRIDDVDVSPVSPVKADVTILPPGHGAAVELLRAVSNTYSERLKIGHGQMLVDFAIKRHRDALLAQRRAFLSYRTQDRDSFHLCRSILNYLRPERVFWDRDGLPAGVDYVVSIEKELASCAILLALIGPDWADAKDDQGRRALDDPDDWVRIEIRSALARPKIPVIPVLQRGALLPHATQLPPDLQPLLLRQAHSLADDSWDHDFGRLMKTVENSLAECSP